MQVLKDLSKVYSLFSAIICYFVISHFMSMAAVQLYE